MKTKYSKWKSRLVLLLTLYIMTMFAGCGAREAQEQSKEERVVSESLTGESTVCTVNELGTDVQEAGTEPEERGTGSQERGTGSQETGMEPVERGTGSQERGMEPEERGTGSQERGMEPEERGTESQETAEYDNFPVDPEGSYTTAEDVSLYLYTFGELPDNFITKKEARALGWSGGSLEPYAPGKCIGGDWFGNYEGNLPEVSGRAYYECDIDTLGADSRGAKRLVYSDDGLIYYTEDHYETFTLLYGEE